MNEEILHDKIQILIEATWQCGFYAGVIEHGNMIQTEKERYRRLQKDALDKRNVARKELVNYIHRCGNQPYETLDSGHEVYRL